MTALVFFLFYQRYASRWITPSNTLIFYILLHFPPSTFSFFPSPLPSLSLTQFAMYYFIMIHASVLRHASNLPLILLSICLSHLFPVILCNHLFFPTPPKPVHLLLSASLIYHSVSLSLFSCSISAKGEAHAFSVGVGG